MDDFMSKPITTKELERVLRAARPRPPSSGHGVLGGAEIDALLRLTAGSPETLRQIIDDYFEASARLVGAIERAAAQGDARALEHAAHSLKGASGQMGAHDVMHEAAFLEKAAASGDFASARERLGILRRKHELARKRLSEVRETAPTA